MYNDLMEYMIHTYGFEEPTVVMFCRLCETNYHIKRYEMERFMHICEIAIKYERSSEQ